MSNLKNVAAIVNTLVAEYEVVTDWKTLQRVADRALDYRAGLDSRERRILGDAYLTAESRLPTRTIRPLVSIG